MRRLWQLRAGVVASALVALLAAVWSVEKITFSPPGLTSRSLEMATASTHVIVDTPKSTVLDLRQDTYNFESLTNRAVLLGNVIANGQVREDIAARAHVPAEVLQIAAPLTSEQPRPRVDSAHEKQASDILKSNDQYRLNIQGNPTVPVLDIYSQAPTAKAAEDLANAAVTSLESYLTELAASQRTPEEDQVQLVQLGRAQGAVLNQGIEWQVALLTFLLTFAASCATVIFLARVRRGWGIAALSERPAGA